MNALFAILDYADYNTRVISDLKECQSVVYHKRYMNTCGAIGRLAYKLRSIPERCFGSWFATIELYRLFGNTSFLNDECPVLIVYECNLLARNIKLLEGLRRRCPRLKLVLIVTNIIGAAGSPESHLDEQREVFDLIITFSEDDAERYCLVHYEGMYSSVSLEGLRRKNDDYEYDLYFCGRDKGRVRTLMLVAETLRRHAVSYRFDIIGECNSKEEGFFYHNTLISVEEMLCRASKAKTVLEIMADPDNKGSSLRPYEVYALKMKLLSDNRFIKNKPWFNPKQISVFEDCEQIDIDFIRTPLKPEDAQDIGILSPVRFLEFIARELGLQFKEKRIAGCER